MPPSLAPPPSSARPSGAVQVKGHALRQQINIISELLEPEYRARFFQLLPAPLRGALQDGLLPSGWYPVEWAELAYVAAHETSHIEVRFPERVACEGIDRDLTGLYRFIAKLVSPQKALAYADRILSTYFRGPKVEILEVGPGRLRLCLFDCPGLGEFLWRDIVASIVRIGETVGARDVRSRVDEGGTAEDARTVLSFRWAD